MTPNRSFWGGKRVFLTGHTGFKGAWLSLWLARLEAEVIGFANGIPTRPSLFEVARVAEKVRDLRADVRNPDQLHEALEQARPSIVIHMAAQSLVRQSYVSPVETYQTNVLGTVNLLEALRRASTVKAVLIVTSDKCYQNDERSRSFRESDPLGGRDPYSSSKACQEIATATYRASFFASQGAAAIATARAGNVIGGGDWAADRLIPDAMRAFASNKPLAIRNPESVRPWQHVLEPLCGYLLLVEKLFSDGHRWAEAWNFGPADADAKPVEYIVDRLVSGWGGAAAWVTSGGQHPHEASLLKLDCSKARRELGWTPKWRLERALDAVIGWHRAFEKKADMQSFSMQQIEEYCG